MILITWPIDINPWYNWTKMHEVEFRILINKVFAQYNVEISIFYDVCTILLISSSLATAGASVVTRVPCAAAWCCASCWQTAASSRAETSGVWSWLNQKLIEQNSK